MGPKKALDPSAIFKMKVPRKPRTKKAKEAMSSSSSAPAAGFEDQVAFVEDLGAQHGAASSDTQGSFPLMTSPI
jgi:hypothetical protein